MIIPIEHSDDYDTSSDISLDFNSIIFDWRQLEKLSQKMRKELDVCDNRSYFVTYKNSFSVRKCIQWMMDNLDINEERSIFLGNLMRNQHLIHHVTDREQKFTNETGLLFRFQIDEEYPYNWRKVWINDLESHPCVVIEELLNYLLHITKVFYFAEESLSLDSVCDAMKKSDLFLQFEISVCQLQKVKLNRLSSDEKLSFWVNLYNLMSLHSFIRCGESSLSFFNRKSFFRDSQYIISGHNFSLDDVEHGILRARYRQFSDVDIRSLFKVTKTDPRIHSVLNCITHSSPRHIIIRHCNVNKYLDYACFVHIQSQVEISPGKLGLPKVFYWYKEDFEDLLGFIYTHLNDDQKDILGSSPSISYLDYDWTPFIDPESFVLEL
eukprot:TRINITY_DN11798_c0_g1_i1.p1 TRINITY_DN11798_c0_g1~~TRINITY_DN11798_c0_g1_i1.p1  ORF type:complete len:380 (+),score=53.26 TRINITY_DN11798_c0_g1_i1:62-1201(+)